MKKVTTLSTLIALTVAANAAVMQTVIPQSATPGDPVSPNDDPSVYGWSQSELNPVDSQGEYPLAFVQDFNGTMSPAIGAYYDTPQSSVFSITHDGAGNKLAGTTIDINFAFLAATNYPGQDSFSITISDDSLGEIVSLNLTDTLSRTSTMRNFQWDTSLGIKTYTSIGTGLWGAVYENTPYTFRVQFRDINGDLGLELSVISSTNQVMRGALLDGGADATFDSLSMVMIKDDASSDWGDDIFSIQSTNAALPVPETNSLMLIAISSFVLIMRRQRTV